MNTNYSSEVELTSAKSIIDNFIRCCSHTLKSPVSSIEGLVMIAERHANEEEVNHCLSMIQKCATSLQEMIHKLEEYTIVQKRELDQEEILANDLVELVVNEFEHDIEEKSIFVSTNVAQSTKWVSDMRCSYIILRNLIGNAIQFIDANKKLNRVNIKVDVAPSVIIVEVWDNGIGIPDKETSRVFEPFHRSSSQSKGSGLGLFLVKGAVDKLNATIDTKSAEKVGTLFHVTIPNRQCA